LRQVALGQEISHKASLGHFQIFNRTGQDTDLHARGHDRDTAS